MSIFIYVYEVNICKLTLCCKIREPKRNVFFS